MERNLSLGPMDPKGPVEAQKRCLRVLRRRGPASGERGSCIAARMSRTLIGTKSPVTSAVRLFAGEPDPEIPGWKEAF